MLFQLSYCAAACSTLKFADVGQRRCLAKSGQWLENVDQTHLALVSGKLVLQTTVLPPNTDDFPQYRNAT